MAFHSRIHVYNTVLAHPVMPIFHHNDLDVCKRILTACYEGGIRICEFTNRGDFVHETYGELRKFGRANFPDMVIGAGTIMDAGTASLYIQLGADFLVAPVLHEDVARVCNRRKIGWMPGTYTLSEISRAEELGAEFVKLFPGQATTPDFIKAIKAPMPWTNIVVTGGVEPTEVSMRSWFGAGASAVGIGSQLFPKVMIEANDWTGIAARIEAAVRIAQSLKS